MISTGAYRTVTIKKDIVIKKAKNFRGKNMMRNERIIYNRFRDNTALCPVIDMGESYIIMPRAFTIEDTNDIDVDIEDKIAAKEAIKIVGNTIIADNSQFVGELKEAVTFGIHISKKLNVPIYPQNFIDGMIDMYFNSPKLAERIAADSTPENIGLYKGNICYIDYGLTYKDKIEELI